MLGALFVPARVFDAARGCGVRRQALGRDSLTTIHAEPALALAQRPGSTLPMALQRRVALGFFMALGMVGKVSHGRTAP